MKALYGYVVRINPFIPYIRYERAQTVREEKSGQTETSAASKKKKEEAREVKQSIAERDETEGK